LIDAMEKSGIVGPYDGRNPRKILISIEEYLNKYDR
jgi:S-DNA-T family DNA segregation ATPase FtsK/SpoIIIE